MRERYKLELHKNSLGIVTDFNVVTIYLDDDHGEEFVYVTYEDALHKGIDILRETRNAIRLISDHIQEKMDNKRNDFKEGYLLEFKLNHENDVLIDIDDISIEKVFIDNFIGDYTIAKFRRIREDGNPSSRAEFLTGETAIFRTIEELQEFINKLEKRASKTFKYIQNINEKVKGMIWDMKEVNSDD